MTFPSGKAMNRHLGQSLTCVERYRELMQVVAPGMKRHKGTQPDTFEREQRSRAADSCFSMRKDDGMSDAQMQSVKEHVRSLLEEAELELVRRLRPFTRACSDTHLGQIIHQCMDVFSGLESGRRELGYTRARVPYIPPVEHILGEQTHRTVDLEGFTHSSKTIKHKAYYIPISENLKRLLQNDPQALEMVHATQKEWSAKMPPKGTEKRIYTDVTSGDLFHDHEMLGDSQRGNPKWNGRIRLCILMYYDGLEVANPLGFARGKHQLGVFLYTIVNLDATVRSSPPYIQLAGIALESDVKRYGPAKVFGGIDPITKQPDPKLWATPGAQMRLLDAGVSTSLQADDGCVRPHDVHAWVLLVIADMLAAHKLGPWGESASAFAPCRQCDFDTREKNAYEPVHFLRDGSACRWKTRVLAAFEERLAELRKLGATARAPGMQDLGVNSLWHALDRTCLPYFNVALGQLQDDMHMDDDGVFRNLAYQVWNQLFRKWAPHGFTLEVFNSALDKHNWGDQPRVPALHYSVSEGAKGGVPSPGAHLRYTASQMSSFIVSSLALMGGLVMDPNEPVWIAWVCSLPQPPARVRACVLM